MKKIKVYVSSSSAPGEIDRATRMISAIASHPQFEITYDWTVPKKIYPVEQNVPIPDAHFIEQSCLDGVRDADVIIFLVPPPHVLSRGFWLEYGYAQASMAMLFICAPDESYMKQSVFLMGKHYNSDEHFLDHRVMGELLDRVKALKKTIE